MHSDVTEVVLHTFLTSTLGGGHITPCTHWMGDVVVPRAHPDLESYKNSAPTRNQIPIVSQQAATLLGELI
jgi:hypothetical protein